MDTDMMMKVADKFMERSGMDAVWHDGAWVLYEDGERYRLGNVQMRKPDSADDVPSQVEFEEAMLKAFDSVAGKMDACSKEISFDIIQIMGSTCNGTFILRWHRDIQSRW